MPRGGYREGGGRPSSFRTGATQTIRVPVALADQVLEIAHKLDRGETIGYDTLPNKEEILEILNEALTLKANAGGAIKAKIKEAIALLK